MQQFKVLEFPGRSTRVGLEQNNTPQKYTKHLQPNIIHIYTNLLIIFGNCMILYEYVSAGYTAMFHLWPLKKNKWSSMPHWLPNREHKKSQIGKIPNKKKHVSIKPPTSGTSVLTSYGSPRWTVGPLDHHAMWPMPRAATAICQSLQKLRICAVRRTTSEISWARRFATGKQ